MIKKFTLFVSIFILSLSVFANSELQLMFTQGMEYSTNGEYSEAAKEYRKMLAIDPLLERARIELAYVLFKSGDYEGARHHFEKVLATVDSINVRLNIKNLLAQIKQELPQTNLIIGFISDSNPNQETSSRKVTIGGLEFDLDTLQDKSKNGYEVKINSKIPLNIKAKTFIKANIEHTDYSGHNNARSYLSNSYGKHFSINTNSSITPEIGLHRFIYQSNTLYSGKTSGVNYYKSFNNTTSAELNFQFLEYKYPDNQYMDGEKKFFTSKLSKLIALNNKFDIQLSYLDSNSTDKSFSYKQPELLISNTKEFKGGWTLGLIGKLNRKKYLEEDPFFGVKREDKEKTIELTILNSLFDINGLSPKVRFGIIYNDSNINLYEFDRSYSKLEFTKEF